MSMLTFEKVNKSYKSKTGTINALQDVSFEVNSGEVVGFIGPNGAGKSTAIKIITGLATATSGKVEIDGIDITKNRVAAITNVGAIIENPDMYLDWTAMANMRYFASLSPNINRDGKEQIEQRINEMLKLVDLFERKGDKVSKFSLGMKQRLGIAQALLNKPKLLILDEPANGLDPEGIRNIREIVTHLAKEKNMAVLVSSHQLAEMQLMCDRFVIINRGKVIGTPTKSDLETMTSSTIIIATNDVVAVIDDLKQKHNLEGKVVAEGKVSVETDMAPGDLAKELILSGITVNGIGKQNMSLEDVFMSLTNKEGK